MKYFYIILFILNFTNNFSQVLVGKTLKESKNEINTYYENIVINQDYIKELPATTLTFDYMDSKIICYFRDQKCFREIIIPEKISAYNNWIEIFNEVFIKEGHNEWSHITDYGNRNIQQIYYPKFETNIFVIDLQN